MSVTTTVSQSFDPKGSQHCQVEVSLCSDTEGVPQTTVVVKTSFFVGIIMQAIYAALGGLELDVPALRRIGVRDFTIFFQLYAWGNHYDAFCMLADFIEIPEKLQDQLVKWCEAHKHIDDRLKRVHTYEAHRCFAKFNTCVVVTMRMYAGHYTQSVMTPSKDMQFADIKHDIECHKFNRNCPISASMFAFMGDLDNLRKHADDAFTKDVIAASIAGGGKCEEYVRKRMRT